MIDAMLEHLKWLAGLPFLGWIWKRRSERRERDRAVFTKLDALLPEKTVMNHLDALDVPIFRANVLGDLMSYDREGERVENDFLDPKLREHHSLLTASLRDLLEFLGPRTRRHWRSDEVETWLELVPFRNIDAEGDSLKDAHGLRAVRNDLAAHFSAIENHFRRYRRSVSERLHL